MSDAFEELREIVLGLRPRAFHARIDMWRRGGISETAAGERVGGTRPHKFPHFDATDEMLNAAESEYREAIDGLLEATSRGEHAKALPFARDAAHLEHVWLKPLITPDAELAKELNRLVSDAQSCLTCGDTKEAWVRRRKKLGVRSPLWKLRGGDCGKCWQEKRRAREQEVASA